ATRNPPGGVRAPAYRQDVRRARAVRSGSRGARRHSGDSGAGVGACASGFEVGDHRPAKAGARRRRFARTRRRALAGGGRRAGAALLGRKTLEQPAVAVAPVAQAIVQTVVAVLPELVGLRSEPVAAPVLRARQLAAFVFAPQLRDGFVELLAAREHAPLP